MKLSKLPMFKKESSLMMIFVVGLCAVVLIGTLLIALFGPKERPNPKGPVYSDQKSGRGK